MSTSIYILGLISLLAGTAVSGFLYYKQQEIFGQALKTLLFALRSLAFALILFILIAPFINFKTKSVSKPLVAILVDNSSSMLYSQDSTLVKEDLVNSIESQFENLENADFALFSFDEEIYSEAPDFKGEVTDISNALKYLSNKTDAEKLAAVVLVTDGIVNRGTNPLYQIENSFLPVYTFGIGDSTKQRDLAIVEVRSPEFVFRGDEIFIETSLSAESVKGEVAEIQLKANGVSVASKKVNIANNSFASVLSFKVEAKKAGITVFEIVAKSLEGEQNLSNNSRQFLVEVIENRKKIAVVASSPSPDVMVLREGLKKVDAYDVSYLDANKRKAISSEIELAIVFFQAFADPNSLNATLGDYKGPIWLFVDPLADSRMFSKKFEWISKIGRPQGIVVKPILNESFGLFKLSSNTLAELKNLVSIEVFPGTIRVNGSMESLLEDPQGNSISSYGMVDGRRIALTSMKGLWKLNMDEFKRNENHKAIDEWLQLSAQYLTSSASGNRLKIRYEKQVSSSEEIKIQAEVYDASFQLVRNADVKLSLKNERGQNFDYAFYFKSADYEAVIGALEPGKYTFSATAKLGDETLRNTGAFVVEEQGLESRNTRANFLLLNQIAESTGGKFFGKNELELLVDDLNEQAFLRPIEKVEIQSLSLVDLKWLFAIAILLMSAEWLLRRYYGTI